ncbi:MAG TPA: DUF72 domain-containing protein [Chryseolinea sp.]|nr:DUF72 domain-containing protein [Chryseolinea sp.]
MRSTQHPSRYYSGLSGIQLPVPKYMFPEEHQSSSRLQYYSTFYNSIEVNSTFYKLPLKRTLDTWNKAVSVNFKFTFKFWKQVTHNKGLLFNPIDVEQFMGIVNNIGIKKGCLLLQFPPSIKIQSIDQVAHLLSQVRALDPNRSWDIAMEFRDNSWYAEEVYTLTAFYKAIIVIHDKAGKSSPFSPVISDSVYVRFHGPSGNYRGSYEKAFLSEYSSYIKEWLLDNKTVYVYFNNTMGDAFNNLITLNSFLDDS